MPFGFRHRDQQEAADVEWYASLADVPGVDWSPPFPVAVDERLARARPVPTPSDERYAGGPSHRWVDERGQPIAEPYALDDSPAALLVSRLYDETPERQLERALIALAHPGGRHDYAQALSRAEHTIRFEGVLRFDVLETVLRGHVSLVLAAPAAALAPPWATYETPLERAAEPVVALMSLYQGEGFLREAMAVERLLDLLPEDARPRYVPEPRPRELADALRRLQ